MRAIRALMPKPTWRNAIIVLLLVSLLVRLVVVVASFISALFSPATMLSLFGDFERMGGVWAWLHLLLFFLLLRTLRDEDWPWILNGALIVSVVVSISAIVEHRQFAAL